MKIRSSFVSNSSSSSFTCEVCNKEDIGWDWDCLSAGMIQTYDGKENGVNICCKEHYNKFLKENNLEKEFEDYIKEVETFSGFLEECRCCVCKDIEYIYDYCDSAHHSVGAETNLELRKKLNEKVKKLIPPKEFYRKLNEI